MQPVIELADRLQAGELSLFIMDCSEWKKGNVYIERVKIEGRNIVDSTIVFAANICNSSPEMRDVEIIFTTSGRTQRAVLNLAPAGEDGDSSEVRFSHHFDRPGTATGRIHINLDDDIPADNTHVFSLEIGRRSTALVVRGRHPEGGGWWFDPAAMISVQLDWRDPDQSDKVPWLIRKKSVEHGEFASEQLEDIDAIFFCEMPTFTEESARGVVDYVEAGGTAFFFLGPDIDIETYNRLFFGPGSPFLPARIGKPVGQVGTDAPTVSVSEVDSDHPCFTGLFEESEDYLAEPILVHRRFSLQPAPGARILLKLQDGGSLLVSRKYGEGNVLLCAAPASLRWSPNLPTRGIFLPMIVRAALLNRPDIQGSGSTIAGSPVSISPSRVKSGTGPQQRVSVTPPGSSKPTDIEPGSDGSAVFTKTGKTGLYNWETFPDRVSGVFAVNPFGPEGELSALPSENLKKELESRGIEKIYTGKSLQQLHEAALADSEGRNWWDLLLLSVIMVLIFECVVANRRQAAAE
jgi:hypothetical protein